MSTQEFDEITVQLRDPDNQLVKMIEYIKGAANIGHSFEVVVDPDMREYRKSFFMDGDGSFYIKEVKKNKRIVKLDGDKLIETYLERIQ